MQAARARLHHTLVGGHSCHPIDVRRSIEVSELFFLHEGGSIPSLGITIGRQNWPAERPELGNVMRLCRGTPAKIF